MDRTQSGRCWLVVVSTGLTVCAFRFYLFIYLLYFWNFSGRRQWRARDWSFLACRRSSLSRSRALPEVEGDRKTRHPCHLRRSYSSTGSHFKYNVIKLKSLDCYPVMNFKLTLDLENNWTIIILNIDVALFELSKPYCMMF